MVSAGRELAERRAANRSLADVLGPQRDPFEDSDTTARRPIEELHYKDKEKYPTVSARQASQDVAEYRRQRDELAAQMDGEPPPESQQPQPDPAPAAEEQPQQEQARQPASDTNLHELLERTSQRVAADPEAADLVNRLRTNV